MIKLQIGNFDVPYISEADLDRLTFDDVIDDDLMPNRLRPAEKRAWLKYGIVPPEVKFNYREKYNLPDPMVETLTESVS